jgi:hypothetical protein
MAFKGNNGLYIRVQVGDKWASDEIIPAYVKISLKWNMNKVIFYSGYNTS